MKLQLDPYYVRPNKAFQRMKKAHNIRQTVYIYGVSGYGKTSLVTSYLGRRVHEYYTSEEVRDIPLPEGRIQKRERIVVIDDLYRLESSEDRQAAYEVIQALSEHPDIWLILISRAKIPTWLMPIHVLHIFGIIAEEHLTLNSRETEEYFTNWGMELVSETLEKIHEECRGYPLAMRIVAIHLSHMDDNLRGEARQQKEFELVALARTDFMKYLVSSVLYTWEEELRTFLFQLSILESFDLEMAQFVTGKTNAGDFLRRAEEIGNFLKSEMVSEDVTIFTLRLEMVEASQRLLIEQCSKSELTELYQRAGDILRKKGEISKALPMYEKANNEPAIIELLIENARIHPGAGYYWELRHYYLGLSDTYTKKNPIMMCALSMLHSIMLNDEESERWYRILESYYQNTEDKKEKKLAKERLFYLDIALPHRGTRYLPSLFKNSGLAFISGNYVLPELSLTNNQPSILDGGKDFSDWTRQDKFLATTIGNIVEQLLGNFGKGIVQLALAESLFEKGKNDPEVYHRTVRGQMQAEVGGKAELSFVATALLSYLEIMSGEAENALVMLDTLYEKYQWEKPLLTRSIDAMRTRIYLRLGDTEKVRRWMETAPNEDLEFCSLERYRYATKVKAYLMLGQRKKALLLLNRLENYAENRNRTHLLIEIKLLFAILHYRNQSEEWVEALQEAVDLAEPYHFVRIFTRGGAPLYQLLKENRVTFKNERYRAQIYRECKKQAEYYPDYLAEIATETPLLSAKALRILRLQSEGLSIEEIAKEMELSQAGVKYYNRETYRKLGVKGKAAAITVARNRKLL